MESESNKNKNKTKTKVSKHGRKMTTPLQTLQEAFRWMCICPPLESTSKRDKRAHIIFRRLIVYSYYFGVFIHFAYISEYGSSDLAGCVFAFMAMLANASTAYTFTAIHLSRHKIQGIFEELSKIYDARKLLCSVQLHGKNYSTKMRQQIQKHYSQQ